MFHTENVAKLPTDRSSVESGRCKFTDHFSGLGKVIGPECVSVRLVS